MTNVHSAAIDAVIDLAQDALTDSNYPLIISRGPAGTGNCISCEPSYGSAEKRFFSKNATYRVTLIFNCKNSNMQIALNMLEQIHQALTRMNADDFPEDDAWQITGIWTSALPMLVSREEDNTWLYASSLYIDYFVRGD